MTTNPKRPRQSFKSTQCRELRLLRYFLGEESFRRNVLQGIHWGKWKTGRKVFWEKNYRNLVWYSLLAKRNVLISSGLVLSLKTATWLLLHLVPARETRASSGVLRSHCLSALQELVGRNCLPLLLLSKLKNRFCHLIIFVFNICVWLNVMFVAYDVNI